MIRRVAAGLLLAAIFVAGVRVSILRLLLSPHRPPDAPAPAGGVDRKPLRFANDPVGEDVLRFLEHVRADTKPGERIALMMAAPHTGWSYTHWRASYVLSGRHVLPPVAWDEPPDVIALWQTGFGDPHYELVWSDANAAMLRRKR